MAEGLTHTHESSPSIPDRTVEELTRIAHDTRAALAEDERFKEAFTRPVLKKHTEPRQFHRIRDRIMAGVIKKVHDKAIEEGRTLERYRRPEPGKLITSVTPYVYQPRAQEDILRTLITLLAHPPSRLDRHPEGFLDAWLGLALQRMREHT